MSKLHFTSEQTNNWVRVCAIIEGEEVGTLDYVIDASGTRTITSVVVTPSYRGNGVARSLVMHVIDAESENGTIDATCSYAVAVLKRHARLGNG
ncbi:MAG: GNAT family N-acetyltransferase [Bacilli bacterium]